MGNKKLLFISGSLGLGHVVKDLAIAKEIRRLDPEIEFYWLAADPASMMERLRVCLFNLMWAQD